jgi:hypothetical protein
MKFDIEICAPFHGKRILYEIVSGFRMVFHDFLLPLDKKLGYNPI